VATLQDMDDETRAGAQDLFEAYADSGSAEPLQALDTFTRAQFRDLRDVVSALPNAAQPRAERSLSLLAVVADQTRKAAVGAGSTPTEGPGTSGQPSESPSNGPKPHKTNKPAGQHAGSASPGPAASSPEPGLPTVPNPVPTEAPTIPTLPTVLPLPTQLPSTLPPLPDLSELPLLGN
jgi:hypothetical protein